MQNTPFLDKAMESFDQKLDEVGGDPSKLPTIVQPVVLLLTLQAMIDNGGFRYPLESNFPFEPPYSAFSNAYRAIGADDAADRLDKAVAMFPFSHPEKHADLRNEFMDALDENDEFFQLGDAVCGDSRIWQLLDTYVQKNASSFGV